MLLIGLLLMVWHPASSFREAFAAMREQIVAMYPTRRRPPATPQTVASRGPLRYAGAS